MPVFQNAFSPDGSTPGMTLGCFASAQGGTSTESTPAPAGARQESTLSQSMDSSFGPMTPRIRPQKFDLSSPARVSPYANNQDSGLSLGEQKEIGAKLYPMVHQCVPDRAEEIVNKMLELNSNVDLRTMLREEGAIQVTVSAMEF